MQECYPRGGERRLRIALCLDCPLGNVCDPDVIAAVEAAAVCCEQLGHLALDLDFATALERLRHYAAFTPTQNVSGSPAISLPLGMSATGLPIGVQFAAGMGQERLLLEIAYELEQAMPWCYPRGPAGRASPGDYVLTR